MVMLVLLAEKLLLTLMVEWQDMAVEHFLERIHQRLIGPPVTCVDMLQKISLQLVLQTDVKYRLLMP